MNQHSKSRTKRNLLIFTIAILGISALAAFIEPLTLPPDAEAEASGLGQLLWLISPLAVMLLLRLLGGDGWGDLGLRPRFKGNRFWWLASLVIFPLVLTISLLAGVLLGGLNLDANLLSAFGAALLATLVWSLIKNLFEELAWRGYLAPKMHSLQMNTWRAHALVGLIWGTWHLPFIYVFWPYLSPGLLWYFIPLLLLGTISQSVVYGEIRLATGSFWPAWVMHTIGNTLGNSLLLSGLIQLNPGWELWFSPGAESVSNIFLMFAIGYWLHRRRNRLVD